MEERTCTECGGAITGHATRRYCSESCKWLARKRVHGVPCSVCGEPTGWTRASGKTDVTHKRCSLQPCGSIASYRRGCRCADCRTANMVAQREYAESYRRRTGRSLKRKYRPPERRSSDWITQADRFNIYERDGWVCQLCGEPVEQSLHSNEDMAASLDHIVPRSSVDVPDHSPENLRLAHRLCNVKRYWAEVSIS